MVSKSGFMYCATAVQNNVMYVGQTIKNFNFFIQKLKLSNCFGGFRESHGKDEINEEGALVERLRQTTHDREVPSSIPLRVEIYFPYDR